MQHQLTVVDPPAVGEALQRVVDRVLHGLMQQATHYHRLGQLPQAQGAYRTVLREQPHHADANHNLGVIALGTGDFVAALPHFQVARETQPGNWQYWISHVDALILAGQPWHAARMLEDARRNGMATAAIEEIIERLLGDPVDSSPAVSAEGNAPDPAEIVALTLLLNQERFVEMEQAAQGLTQRFERNAFGWRMRGMALQALERDSDAAEALQQVAVLSPDDSGNFNTLGLTLARTGRLVEAELSFRRASQLAPDDVSARSNLGMMLHLQGRLLQAETCLRRCVAMDEKFHVAYLNLSVVLVDMGRAEEAEVAVRGALQVHPEFAQAYNGLGYLQKDQGHLAEAEASLRRALAIDPDYMAANNNLLFVLNYDPDKTADEIFDAYRDFNTRFGLPFKTQWRPHTNQRNPQRRLRVGYVCPILSQHSTRHFLEPLLAHHDHTRVEVFAYSELVLAADASTQRYRDYFDGWVATAGMSDDALAQRIRDDGIDVLVDIAGHTRGNRLAVFARKPAPVSLHWLDFGYTTGLTAIDHYLTDAVNVPAGSDSLFAEVPWRLPVPAFVYRPGPEMGEVSVLPALARGYVTFGTLTRAIRINYRTIRVWAEILRQVEGARLVVDSGNFKTAASQEALAQKFAAYGIGRERLEIGCHSPPWDVLRGIDIGLDCFPHNSGTTLFEMLFMGVPFVTLAGRPSVGRLGSAILAGIGQAQWVAESEDAYVEQVVALARDLPGLQRIRESLRAQMQASPVMDEPGFARHVERAYTGMFERWSNAIKKEESAARSPLAASATSTGSGAVGVSLDDAQARAARHTMALAVAQHRLGKLDLAEDLYREILVSTPAHADANHNLAVIALETGHAAKSLAYFRAALAAQPANWQYWLSLFDALLQAGDLDEAVDLLETRQRVGLGPDVLSELTARAIDAMHCAIGNDQTDDEEIAPAPVSARALKSAGRAERARVSIPADQVRHVEGLFRQGQLEQVVELALAISLRFPQAAFGWKALGAARVNLGLIGDAIPALRKAVLLMPADVGARSNLGFALQSQGQPVEAEVHLRVGLRLQPEFPAALINLGATLLGQKRFDEAGPLFRQGLAAEPDYFPAHNHLGQVLDEQGRLVESVASYRKALEILAGISDRSRAVQIHRAQAHQSLAMNYAKLADYTDVVAQANAAMEVLPNDRETWERRLYALSYHPELSVNEIFTEFVRWGDRYPAPTTDFSAVDRTPGRRLRIGYVSPDFRAHTSRFYFWPLFAHHDFAKVELFAYSNVRSDDSFTEKFKTVFNHWRDIRELTDAQAAAQIKADGIDILVDGCNHMRDERLGIFALKPAPIQVTWLGAAWTTGLAAVDYVLFDRYIAPPETIAREHIVRLPHCFASFASLSETDTPQAPPCLKNGFVTFGYSGRTERLNHKTFRAWGQILKQLPTARLVLDFSSFADPLNQLHYTQLMQAQGLDTSRVVMRNSSNIFQGLHDFDILLDSFPHSGGTMLVDALWMGVPTLTLAGRPPLGRIGTTFMMNFDLPQWVAWSEEEYVRKACEFALDVAGRVTLRAGMRARMENSPFMDGKGFAQAVEWAFDEMWNRYCRGEPPSPMDVPSLPGKPR